MQEKIEKILSELPKERREKALMALDYSPEFLKTPSIGLNKALGGGLPFGRIVTFWGTKSAGKSSLVLQIIAEAQEQEKACLYVDVEGTYDDRWAQRLKVNSENLFLEEARDVPSVTNACRDYLNAGVDVVVIDSVSAMTPAAQIEDGEIKDFEDNNSMAISARDMGKFLNVLNYVNNNSLIVLIAHGSMGPAGAIWKFQMKGGNALQYYSSQVVKLMSNNTSDLEVKEITAGNRVLQRPGYRKVKYKVDWNKVGPQGIEGEYYFHFAGDFVGIDWVRDLILTGVEYGYIEKNGTWLSWNGQKAQGAEQAAKILKDDKQELDRLIKEIYNVK